MRDYSSDAVSEFGAHEELQLLAILVSAAALLAARRPAADPVSDPARRRRAAARFHARGAEPGPAPRPRARRDPPAAALLGCLQHGPPRSARNLRPISFLAIGLVAADDGHGGRDGALRDRTVVAGRVRPRRRGLADRSARRDDDRQAARRSAARCRDHRGREPRQRRHGARPLQVRGRRGAHRHVLAPRGRREPRLVGSRRHRSRPRRRPGDPIRPPARSSTLRSR